MSFLSASKVIFTEPSEVNSTGFHPFETTQGEVELFVNVDDHPDGNWILASNFDASDGDFANEHGYTAPSSYHLPGTSGSVTSNFSNYEGSSSLAEGPSEMKAISNNADDNITFANGSFGTAEQNGPSPHMTYKTFRPETNGYEWDEIKFRCVYSGGNDAYQNSSANYSSRSGSDYDLFANSSDGGKLLAGEPGNNAEHVAEIASAGASGESDRDFNQLNYTPKNLLIKDLNSSGQHVSQFETNEITETMNNKQIAPPCLTLHTDEEALNERSVYEKWYIWIR